MGYPTASKDTTIPVGSTVKIVVHGECYSTYAAMANFMGLKKWNSQPMPERRSQDGQVYTVVAKALHEREVEGELVGLEDSEGRQVIMSLKGVELVTPPTLSGQVAKLEEQLAAVTKERDELKEQIATVRRLFTAQ
ncbi:hypothetical protein CNR37_00109 [Pseudomonas phage ventosus]|uniref:Uncharacterized protein n=1 Tax=Pseudomonas phage ventosus TaxID=2048980 RepID=A0A2H4P811_9CAUD|nr:hypothetical protein CNR37_00109 [Pseudomonas phage ventosus]